MSSRIVATIPTGLGFAPVLAAMKGMGQCFPQHTLSLTSLADGSMAIVHTPDATPEDPAAQEWRAQIQVALGVDEPSDMIAYAIAATNDGDHRTGLLALAGGLAAQLEAAEAANYLTYTITHPDVGSYAVTIQRAGAIGPAERIAALEADLARAGGRSVESLVAEFHQMIGSPPWTGPIADMPADTLKVRNRLVEEETAELVEATNAGDLVRIADALADLEYVIHGTAYTYGIPLRRVTEAVHASNMTKDPGPDGKAVKGARYAPPDIAGALAGPIEPAAVPEVTGREVHIRTVDPDHLRGLEQALGIRDGSLDGFRRAWTGDDAGKVRRLDSVRLDRQVNLDTAVAYARKHGLRYLEVRETTYDSGA